MTEGKDSPDLEAALTERAERLAAQYLERGREQCAAISKEQRQRLRTREERISQEASASADRLYRRRVQAAELRLQGELDRRRWALIESVLDALPERLAALSARGQADDGLLGALLASAVESVGDGELVAALGRHDLERLRDGWKEFCGQAVPGKQVALDPQPLRCSGGVRVSGHGDRVRVDVTFEGRIDRHRDELINIIAERLFAHDPGQVG